MYKYCNCKKTVSEIFILLSYKILAHLLLYLCNFATIIVEIKNKCRFLSIMYEMISTQNAISHSRNK